MNMTDLATWGQFFGHFRLLNPSPKKPRLIKISVAGSGTDWFGKVSDTKT